MKIIRVREIPPGLSRPNLELPGAPSPRPLAILAGVALTTVKQDEVDPTLVRMRFAEDVHLQRLRDAGVVFDVVEG